MTRLGGALSGLLVVASVACGGAGRGTATGPGGDARLATTAGASSLLPRWTLGREVTLFVHARLARARRSTSGVALLEHAQTIARAMAPALSHECVATVFSRADEALVGFGETPPSGDPPRLLVLVRFAPRDPYEPAPRECLADGKETAPPPGATVARLTGRDAPRLSAWGDGLLAFGTPEDVRAAFAGTGSPLPTSLDASADTLGSGYARGDVFYPLELERDTRADAFEMRIETNAQALRFDARFDTPDPARATELVQDLANPHVSFFGMLMRAGLPGGEFAREGFSTSQHGRRLDAVLVLPGGAEEQARRLAAIAQVLERAYANVTLGADAATGNVAIVHAYLAAWERAPAAARAGGLFALPPVPHDLPKLEGPGTILDASDWASWSRIGYAAPGTTYAQHEVVVEKGGRRAFVVSRVGPSPEGLVATVRTPLVLDPTTRALTAGPREVVGDPAEPGKPAP